MAFAGLLIAAGGYWLISKWPVDVLAARHDLGLFTLPTLDTDLAIAGLGSWPGDRPADVGDICGWSPQPSTGSPRPSVVVARMIGMLIGIARAERLGPVPLQSASCASLPSATGNNLTERLAAQAAAVRAAYVMQYGEIFGITAIVCVVGALLGLLISGRHEHADEPAPTDSMLTTRRPH